MKTFILWVLLVVILGAAPAAFSQTTVDKTTPKLTAELIKAAKEIHNAEITGQSELLKKKVASDFILCGTKGELVKRAAYLEQPAMVFEEYGFSLDDIWIIDRGNMATLVYVLEINTTASGKQSRILLRVSDVFSKVPGGWELLASHRTNITESNPKSLPSKKPAGKG